MKKTNILVVCTALFMYPLLAEESRFSDFARNEQGEIHYFGRIEKPGLSKEELYLSVKGSLAGIFQVDNNTLLLDDQDKGIIMGMIFHEYKASYSAKAVVQKMVKIKTEDGWLEYSIDQFRAVLYVQSQMEFNHPDIPGGIRTQAREIQLGGLPELNWSKATTPKDIRDSLRKKNYDALRLNVHQKVLATINSLETAR